jgi:hypothetical protein
VTFFIVQITDYALKVVKASSAYGLKKEILAFECEPLAAPVDDKLAAEKLGGLLKRLGFSGQNVILALARSQATCRLVKLPSASEAEIEKIVSLQAPKYLPYAPSELISAFQLINTDRLGYSNINLVIVQKEVVARQLAILQSCGAQNIQVGLSSYGLAGLFTHLGLREARAAVLVDIDDNQVELAVFYQSKMLFSRSFRLNPKEPIAAQLSDEINRTSAAYLKESQAAEVEQAIFLSSRSDALAGVAESVSNQSGLACKTVNYCLRPACSKSFMDSAGTLRFSLAGLMGLGLEELPETLNLMPAAEKEGLRRQNLRKRQIKSFLLGLAVVFVWALGLAKNMDNKKAYLAKLDAEISKLAQEAKPFEELEKRAQLLEVRLKKSPSALGLMRELYRAIPQEAALSNFTYEEDKLVSLRGSSPVLAAVFKLVQALEGSPVFNGFTVKVKYATKKPSASGETVDFQIDCLKGAR